MLMAGLVNEESMKQKTGSSIAAGVLVSEASTLSLSLNANPKSTIAGYESKVNSSPFFKLDLTSSNLTVKLLMLLLLRYFGSRYKIIEKMSLGDKFSTHRLSIESKALTTRLVFDIETQ